MRRALIAAVAVSLVPFAAFADEPLEVSDLPMTVEVRGGGMVYGIGSALWHLGEYGPIPDAVEDSGEYFTGDEITAPQIAPESPDDGYRGYVAEYSDLYNSDGPSRDMPGWHDGYLETYYNASAHYRAGEWAVDSEGFYRDGDRYVVGVDIADTNPATGEPYQIGDIVETGKGEAVVMDYGSGARVHDFATVW